MLANTFDLIGLSLRYPASGSGDLLDTVLVREALTETAKASGQFVTRQDDPTRGLYVLEADGNWVTAPVVSILLRYTWASGLEGRRAFIRLQYEPIEPPGRCSR